MTPKEKAEQLFQLYLPFVESGNIEEIKNRCKKCALIAVDEILNNFGSTAEGKHFYTAYSTLDYWTAVKQEIENL